MRPRSERRELRPAILIAASLVAPACASTAANESSTVPASDRDEGRVAELDRRVRQLEAELAATSGGQRAPTRIAPAPPTDDESDSALETDDVPAEAAGPAVVLRLHEERPADLPVVTERLAVAPLPAIPPSAQLPPAAMRPQPTSATPTPAAPTSLAPLLTQAPLTTTQPTTAPLATVAPQPGLPTDEDTTAYRAGLDHLTARRFEAAISSLSSFLRDHPGSPRADDAMYWRATANYALHRYADALVDYERVPRVAPRGEHAADALYHAALCHRRLGADAQARSLFARVRRDYPDSVAARLAAREETS